MKTIEIISGLLVLSSYPFYILRIWQGKIIPNLMSWTIWLLISWSILLSYNSAEGQGAFYAALGGTVGCTLVFLSALLNKHEKSFNKIDIICGSIGLASLILWCFLQEIFLSFLLRVFGELFLISSFLEYISKNDVWFMQYALYLAILSDLMGIVPSARFLRKNPDKDRPFLWIVFSVGYGLALFAIEDYNLVSCSLPASMFIAPSFVWIPLIQYRIKNKIPIKEWF